MQPETPDNISYPVARMGGDFGGEAEVGPISRKKHATLVLSVGTAEWLPKFVVQVVMRSGADEWDDTIELPDPRYHQTVFSPCGSETVNVAMSTQTGPTVTAHFRALPTVLRGRVQQLVNVPTPGSFDLARDRLGQYAADTEHER